MKKTRLLQNGEFYLGLALVIFSLVIFFSIGGIKNPSARVWPYVIMIPLGLSSCAILLSSLKNSFTDVGVFRLTRKEIATIVAILLTAILEEFIGLLPALFLLTLVINGIIQGFGSKKVLVWNLIFSVVFIIVCYLVFDLWLEMYMPIGSLFT
ncbi:MAG: tripartite tricarboxylate transporter TctB family protein [Eubacteriales bacterium]